MCEVERGLYALSCCSNDLSNSVVFTVAAFYVHLGSNVVERLRTGLWRQAAEGSAIH